jgi:hypothetical protein
MQFFQFGMPVSFGVCFDLALSRTAYLESCFTKLTFSLVFIVFSCLDPFVVFFPFGAFVRAFPKKYIENGYFE